MITYAGLALAAVGGGLTVEHELVGAEPTPEAFKAAAQTAAQQCDPVTDQRGPRSTSATSPAC